MSTAFCFDLDGTVTTTEVLPCIAADLDIADEIATLTRITIDGTVPFEASFRLRCTILGQVPPERVRSIVEAVPLDRDIFHFIRSNPENCFLVTGNLDIWIEAIVQKCGCGVFSSRADYANGRLKVSSVLNKADAIKSIREMGKFRRIVAVGDGANDAPMMDVADVAVAYGGVHAPAESAIQRAHYIANSGGALCRLLETL